MNHEAAQKNQAVDRYLLGDMADEEREEFESHYFTCLPCAEEVRTGFLFKENARKVLNEPVAPRRAWWSFPVLVPSFAAAALAAVVIFQNAVTLPGLRAPQIFAPAVILDGVTRDSLPQVKSGEPLRFQFALDSAPAGTPVKVELADESGRVLRTGSGKAPGANRPMEVFFPGNLQVGRYSIVVRSDPAGAELTRNLFRMTKETHTE